MNLFLASIVLAFPTFAQEANQPARERANEKMPIQKLDGTWTVTYAEMDGKKMENTAFTQVTIKNNTVTCRHDGKEKSWKMEFGPHNMVRCTELIDGKITSDTTAEKRDPNDKNYHTHHGVYIASREYFCLCLNKGRDNRDEKDRSNQSATTPRFGDQGAYGAHFVIILHRSGTQTSSSR